MQRIYKSNNISKHFTFWKLLSFFIVKAPSSLSAATSITINVTCPVPEGNQLWSLPNHFLHSVFKPLSRIYHYNASHQSHHMPQKFCMVLISTWWQAAIRTVMPSSSLVTSPVEISFAFFRILFFETSANPGTVHQLTAVILINLCIEATSSFCHRNHLHLLPASPWGSWSCPLCSSWHPTPSFHWLPHPSVIYPCTTGVPWTPFPSATGVSLCCVLSSRLIFLVFIPTLPHLSFILCWFPKFPHLADCWLSSL